MDRHFSAPLVTEWREVPASGSSDYRAAADREMACPRCGTRLFSSRAGDLVVAGFRCPRCAGPMSEPRSQPPRPTHH